MDFLKRIFRKESEGVKSETDGALIEMSLEEVEEGLNKRLLAKKEEALKKLIPVVDEILRQKRAAKEIIRGLAEMDFDEDVKERTYKPILTSKPVYIRGMLEGLKGIRDSVPEDYEGLEAFYIGVTKALKSIQTVQLKQGRYMKHAFEKEILRLGSVLNRIIDENRRLEEGINDVRELVLDAEGVIHKIELVREELGRTEEAEAEKTRLKERLGAIEDDIKAAGDELQRLEGSGEFMDHVKMSEELESLVSMRKNLENMVSGSISPLRRPIRKYEKALERGSSALEPEALKMLNEYAGSLKTAVEREDPEQPYLEKILKGLSDAIETGVIRLDERERKKSLARIEQLRGGQIKNMLTQLRDARKREEQLSKRLSESDVWERREELVKRKESLTSEREKILAEVSRKPTQAGDVVGTVKKEIEEEMSRIEGRPVVIVVPESEETKGDRQDL